MSVVIVTVIDYSTLKLIYLVTLLFVVNLRQCLGLQSPSD